MPTQSWSIAGSDGEPILGDSHIPDTTDPPLGAVLIAHGFKGYKDYGMFPRIAEEFAAAGFIASRFNFSHSGMTNQLQTFARPDLFEKDTWNRQVDDLLCIVRAMQAGEVPGGGLPYVLLGHSRGGAACILFAGRNASNPDVPQPRGVITAAAPSSCNPLTPAEQRQLLEDGFLESPSSRTGQRLRIGRAFLDEQLAQPHEHDLTAQVRRIRCPLLVVHGEADPTVPWSAAQAIASASHAATLLVLSGVDHVFNTPNPMPPGQNCSEGLRSLIQHSIAFARGVCRT